MFYNAFSITDNIALNGRIISEWQTGNDLKGSGLSVVEELLWHLLGDTEENDDNFI
jgi:hypothetical protein